MAEMVKTYEKFSREERFDFNKRMSEKGDLNNSLDALEYSWNKLLGKLIG